MSGRGKVYLVGAGPGDPELLTIKARRLLKSCDVILYDNLVDEDVLDLVEGGDVIYVGKKPGESDKQERINDLMLKKFREGLEVCRLKGGNPVVFGRGGEEYEFLKSEGIDVEIVPGLSSATSVPPLFGIPISHREASSSVSILTGYGAGGSDPDWDCVNDTAVVLMTLGNLSTVVEKLKQNGMNDQTFSALISSGSTNDERLLVGELSRIVDLKERFKIESPGLLIAGDVVERSLMIERSEIAVFRPEGKKETTEDLISGAGGVPLVYEIMGTEKIEGPSKHLSDDWEYICFMSTESVKIVSDMMDLSEIKAVAIGDKTAQKLKELGCESVKIPEDQNSDGVEKLLEKIDVKKERVLALRSSLAEEELEGAVNKDAYRAVVSKSAVDEILKKFETDTPDYTLLTSSGMLRLIIDDLDEEEEEKFLDDLNRSFVISIGPKCSKFLAGKGIDVNYEMENPDLEYFFEEVVFRDYG